MSLLKRRSLALSAALVLVSFGSTQVAAEVEARAPAAARAGMAPVDLTYEKFQLDNGLTVIVHEDHKAPVVGVAVWYRVGSADEPPGKTGFAHLFEHLMYSGSEHHRDNFFRPFERVGATEMNGMTTHDHTQYFQTVPTTALDMALWMESDRMGHLLGAIGQAELDAQRSVVQNEKRQRTSGPYGRVRETVLKNAFPANHPYHHSPIGSMEDLEAASLADVQQWFSDYYGAANATLVLVGDITPAAAREKAQRYFGHIPAGPPVARQQPWIAPRTESTRGVQQDNVTQIAITRQWNVPQRGNPEADMLQLAAEVLGGGQTSRLAQRLVHREGLADSVSVSLESMALAGIFQISAYLREGADLMQVEAAIAEEWTAFLEHGPTEDELARAKAQHRTRFLHHLDSVGRTADLLASHEVALGDPSAYHETFARMEAAGPDAVVTAARKWLSRGDYTLISVPPGSSAAAYGMDAADTGRPALSGRPAAIPPTPRAYSTRPNPIDRSKGVPEVAHFPDLIFPAVERDRLDNGVEVALARRPGAPVTLVSMQFDAGFAADHGRKQGVGTFVAHMLDEGTEILDALEIAKRKQRFGAEIGVLSDMDSTTIGLRAPAADFASALELFAELIRTPAFRPADVERLRQNGLSQIAFEKQQPTLLADRLLPPLIYGDDHPYGVPASGMGTTASFSDISREDLLAFHRDYYRPDNATIFVVGDVTLPVIVAQLNDAFGDWMPPATPLPKKAAGEAAVHKRPRVFLVDLPDAQQSVIAAGIVAPSTSTPDDLSIRLANDVFGGGFMSRLNLNLREDKNWSYGAYSSLRDAVGPRLLSLSVAVQTDRTADALLETREEVARIASTAPPTPDEVERVKAYRVRALPGNYERADAVMRALQTNRKYGRPDDYVSTLKPMLESQTEAEIAAAARRLFTPDALTWLVIGDLSKIEQDIRALDVGEVHVMDTDGKIIR